MNALALTLSDFTKALTHATRQPLAEEFFAWCRKTDTLPHIQWSMSVYGIVCEPSDFLSDLKAKLDRKIEIEKRRSPAHWSFDLNRVITFDQMKATIAKFERAM